MAKYRVCDDRDGSLFIATVRRKVPAPGALELMGTTQKITQKILTLVAQDPSVTRQALATAIAITSDGVKYHLRKLQREGAVSSGPDKGGRWEVGSKATKSARRNPRQRR